MSKLVLVVCNLLHNWPVLIILSKCLFSGLKRQKSEERKSFVGTCMHGCPNKGTHTHTNTRTVNTTVLQCFFELVIIVLTPVYESPGKCPEMALRRGEGGKRVCILQSSKQFIFYLKVIYVRSFILFFFNELKYHRGILSPSIKEKSIFFHF